MSGGHAATPNSETTETVSPDSQNATSSAEPHGESVAGGDHSRERIVTSK